MYVFFCVHVTGTSSTKRKKGDCAEDKDKDNTSKTEVAEKKEEVVPPEPKGKAKAVAKATGKAKGKAKSTPKEDIDKENTYVNPAWHKSAHAWIIKRKTGKQALQASRR